MTGRVWSVAGIIGIGLVFFHPYWLHPSRYGRLKCVIHRHTGFAHMTRGMNNNTINALRQAVHEQDIPVLVRMLDDPDHVTQMTAAQVLARMGAPGLQALKHEWAQMGRQTGVNYNRFDVVREAITEGTGQNPRGPRIDKATERF